MLIKFNNAHSAAHCYGILLLFLVIYSCAGRNNRYEAAPDWIEKTPGMNNSICAVGGSEPTFYREDSKLAAADAARAELSRTLNVRIESIMVDFQSEKGVYVDKAEVSHVSSWSSDVVLVGSKIMHYWYDKYGSGPDKRKGSMYALACLPLDQSEEFYNSLKKKIPDNLDKQKAIRLNAEKVFEELKSHEGP